MCIEDQRIIDAHRDQMQWYAKKNDALVEALRAITTETDTGAECPECSHPLNLHALRPNGPCQGRNSGVTTVSCGCRMSFSQVIALSAISQQEEYGNT